MAREKLRSPQFLPNLPLFLYVSYRACLVGIGPVRELVLVHEFRKNFVQNFHQHSVPINVSFVSNARYNA